MPGHRARHRAGGPERAEPVFDYPRWKELTVRFAAGVRRSTGLAGCVNRSRHPPTIGDSRGLRTAPTKANPGFVWIARAGSCQIIVPPRTTALPSSYLVWKLLSSAHHSAG